MCVTNEQYADVTYSKAFLKTNKTQSNYFDLEVMKNDAIFDEDSYHVEHIHIASITNKNNNYNTIDFINYTNIRLGKDFIEASTKTSPMISSQIKNGSSKMFSNKSHEMNMMLQLNNNYDKEPPTKKQRKLSINMNKFHQ